MKQHLEQQAMKFVFTKHFENIKICFWTLYQIAMQIINSALMVGYVYSSDVAG